MTLAGFVPVRLCCGQRHLGGRCPDGLVMCCMCYGRFPDTELARDADDPSLRWDVCLACDEHERVAIAVRWMAAPVTYIPVTNDTPSRQEH